MSPTQTFKPSGQLTLLAMAVLVLLGGSLACSFAAVKKIRTYALRCGF